MPVPKLTLSEDDRVVAGVCGGLAAELGVDATLVRLVFALLGLAAGAGVVLYFALWAYSSHRRTIGILLLIVAGLVALAGIGLSSRAVAGVGLVAVGLTLIWRRGGSLRPDAPVPLAGLVLAAAGATVLLTGGGGSSLALVSPAAAAGAILLVVGPWLWRLALERDAERTARIRSEERDEVATRVHDSVLQTLALIQRHADEPKRVGSLARRQERELRGWLYGAPELNGRTLVAALASAAADVEELHGVRVELASAGDCELTEPVQQLVLAAREAMTNAAKFSGADEVAVYAEAGAEGVEVFVRDRGAGFDRSGVPAARRGIAESIEGRMARSGGGATVTSSPGEGTEVELTLPAERT
jgi:signal transduction histidine kinase